MGSTVTDQASIADRQTNQNRRQALKRFGRYAAAAPTVMVLLEPREGHAGKGKGRGGGRGGGWGRGGRWGGGDSPY